MVGSDSHIAATPRTTQGWPSSRGCGPTGCNTQERDTRRLAAEAVPARRRLDSHRSRAAAPGGWSNAVPFGLRPMPVNLGRVRAVLFEVPRNAKLAYCLMRDGRVPLAPKVALGASLGLI